MRDHFCKNGYECSIEFSKESDNDRLFIALKFDSRSIAKEVLNKFDNAECLGDRITVSWFKDLRKAKQRYNRRYSPDNDYRYGSRNKYHKRRYDDDDDDDYRRKRRSSSRSRSSSSRSPSPERKSKKSKRKHWSPRRSESRDSERFPVEKTKKKKKKDKEKKMTPESDEDRRKPKHKEEKSKALYDPVDMDISEEEEAKPKHKRTPSVEPHQQQQTSRPRLYSDEPVDYPTSPQQQIQQQPQQMQQPPPPMQAAPPRMMPSFTEDPRGMNPDLGMLEQPRRAKRRFEDMETFRDRRAAEMMSDKPVGYDGGMEQRSAMQMNESKMPTFNGGTNQGLCLPPDKMMLIKDKKDEIERTYRQDCETFAAVTKMLVSKDPDLEERLQRCLRENLKDLGQRCIVELRDSIDKLRSQVTDRMIV